MMKVPEGKIIPCWWYSLDIFIPYFRPPASLIYYMTASEFLISQVGLSVTHVSFRVWINFKLQRKYENLRNSNEMLRDDDEELSYSQKKRV